MVYTAIFTQAVEAQAGQSLGMGEGCTWTQKVCMLPSTSCWKAFTSPDLTACTESTNAENVPCQNPQMRKMGREKGRSGQGAGGVGGLGVGGGFDGAGRVRAEYAVLHCWVPQPGCLDVVFRHVRSCKINKDCRKRHYLYDGVVGMHVVLLTDGC